MSFDQLYEETMSKIDKLIYTDYNPITLKNFIANYKEEQKALELKEKMNEEKNTSAKTRKHYVDWAEVRKHEEKYNKKKYHQIMINEINQMNNLAANQREVGRNGNNYYGNNYMKNKNNQRSYGDNKQLPQSASKFQRMKEFSKAIYGYQ
jgi:hypothetical protein